MNELARLVLPHLDDVLARYDQLRSRGKYEDLSDSPRSEVSEWCTLATTAILRTAGSNSHYATETEAAISNARQLHIERAVPAVKGIVKALRHDVASGYLVRVEELIHASLFSDFLEMAEHLLDEGYKDAAAVLIGGVLEQHLRELCSKSNIDPEIVDAKTGRTRPKKAEAMNTELTAGGIYGKLDQKSVTAWLDLRNDAAHARYEKYTAEQVRLMLQGVRDFIIRYPA